MMMKVMKMLMRTKEDEKDLVDFAFPGACASIWCAKPPTQRERERMDFNSSPFQMLLIKLFFLVLCFFHAFEHLFDHLVKNKHYQQTDVGRS